VDRLVPVCFQVFKLKNSSIRRATFVQMVQQVFGFLGGATVMWLEVFLREKMLSYLIVMLV